MAREGNRYLRRAFSGVNWYQIIFSTNVKLYIAIVPNGKARRFRPEDLYCCTAQGYVNDIMAAKVEL